MSGIWLRPASLTVQRDTAASRANHEQLLFALDRVSATIAATMRTHEVDRRVNDSRTAAPNGRV